MKVEFATGSPVCCVNEKTLDREYLFYLAQPITACKGDIFSDKHGGTFKVLNTDFPLVVSEVV